MSVSISFVYGRIIGFLLDLNARFEIGVLIIILYSIKKRWAEEAAYVNHVLLLLFHLTHIPMGREGEVIELYNYDWTLKKDLNNTIEAH